MHEDVSSGDIDCLGPVSLRGFLVAVRRVGEHDVVEQLHGETQIAAVGVVAGLSDDGVGTTHAVDVPLGRFDGRMLPQVGRVAVVPAEVALVDGLDVVTDRAVVAAAVPGGVQRRW